MTSQNLKIENENEITYFAATDARNKKLPFGIKAKDRLKHVYVIGKTGMGKSTLLENMAIQDIRNGHGLAFIDPHGKTAELLLDYVPAERVRDVLYFAPFDMDFPISFNVMEDVGPDKRHLVSNGLMSAFKKIWVDAWSARMEYILNNILLALLEYPGSTLLGVNRMLADKEYRKRVVENITDVSVKAFWTDEFAKYGDRYMQEAGAAIQNKIGQFIANPLVRNIIGQPKSSFDLRKMMDERKILIVNLSKGRVGEANANLLGSMLITKIYLAAMSRADTPDKEMRILPNFYLYVDEFQSFANESFADILSESRKYKLNLTIAHQYIEQMSEEVRAAVFGNVGTMATFRVGAYDAEVLEKEFAPQFTAQDLVNLGVYQVYLKLMIDGVASQPFSAATLPPIEQGHASYREAIISLSRSVFARTRDSVEKNIRDWHAEGQVAPVDKRQPRQEQRSDTSKSRAPRHDERTEPHQVHRPVATHENRPTNTPRHSGEEVNDSRGTHEVPAQKAVSLEHLKPKPRFDRKEERQTEHKGELRRALEQALKEHQSAQTPKEEAKEKTKEQSPKHQDENQTSGKTAEKDTARQKKEVPEDVLKKLLRPDEK